MTLRDKFEARYPCPEGVRRTESGYEPRKDYSNCAPEDIKSALFQKEHAEIHTARWEAYQAAMEDAVPEGWVVVPNKPTPDMLEACNQVLSDQAVKHGYSPETFDATLAASMYWKAMLSSIPTPDSPNE